MSRTKSTKTTSAEQLSAEAVDPVGQAVTEPEASQEVHEAIVDMATTLQDSFQEQAKVVVVCFGAMQEFVEEVWKHCYHGEILFIEATQPNIIYEALNLVAEGKVTNEFVIVSAGTLPCHTLSYEEMCVHYRRIMADNSQHLDSHLPLRLHAERLAEVVEKGANPDNVEEFLSIYYKAAGIRPVDASFQWGNVLTPVTRANPCHATLVESIHRKKYIVCTTPEALAGVEPAFCDWLLKS